MTQILVLFSCVAVGGCAGRPRAPSRPPATRPDVTSTRREVRESLVLAVYRRTGGIAGTDDRIVLWSDGLAQVSGRMMRTSVVNVPADQLRRVRSLLEDWEQLESAPERNAADAFVVEILHGGKSVVVSDAAPRIPPAFAQVRGILESLGN